MKKFYYDLHVFYSIKDGFSIPIAIESEQILIEEEVINYAIKNDLIDGEDLKHINYVIDITEEEYNDMKRI